MRTDAPTLTRRLIRLLPRPTSLSRTRSAKAAPSDTERRILETATRLFNTQGVAATTMSQLATEAGISREWLYRHHSNRDMVLAAVVRHEVEGLVEELARIATAVANPADGIADAFVYAVRYGRDNPLVRQLVQQRGVEESLDGSRSLELLLGVSIEIGTVCLLDIGDLSVSRATLMAETLSRVALASIVAPGSLTDDATLEVFAGDLVLALLQPSTASGVGR